MKKKILFALCALFYACDSESKNGSAVIYLEAEETITEGIASEDDHETTTRYKSDDHDHGAGIVDGWDVTFSQYLVSIGHIRIARAGSDEHIDETVHVIDLKQLSSSGKELTQFDDLSAERWDEVGYSLIPPTTDSIRNDNVSEEDFNEMVTGECTYLIEGALVHHDGAGTSCAPSEDTCRDVGAEAINFHLCVPATVDFDYCQSDDLPGFVVPASGQTTAAFTLHGDHLFFTSFAEGVEIVERRAQWLANTDTDGDNNITQAELEAIISSDLVKLFPTDLDESTEGDQGYSLSGAPGGSIDSAWDFVVAQLRTQGHFQGEGECEWSVP